MVLENEIADGDVIKPKQVAEEGRRIDRRSAGTNMSEQFRHDVAGENGSKDAYEEDAQAIIVVGQKGVAVLPLER